ncbi:MAG: hypothetical protein WD206_07790 [Actinomycetota bacterium]
MLAGSRVKLSLVALAVAAATFVAVTATAGGHLEQADPDEPSYLLSVDSIANADSETGAVALVEYSGAWSHGDFPGYSECEATVSDAAGNVVGIQGFELASFSASTDGAIDVEVSGTPASASIACAPASKPSERAGYVISNPMVMDADTDDPWLTFRADWATDEPPQVQRCEAVFATSEGARIYEFDVSLPDGGEAHVLLPPGLAADPVKDVSCRAY